VGFWLFTTLAVLGDSSGTPWDKRRDKTVSRSNDVSPTRPPPRKEDTRSFFIWTFRESGIDTL